MRGRKSDYGSFERRRAELPDAVARATGMVDEWRKEKERDEKIGKRG